MTAPEPEPNEMLDRMSSYIRNDVVAGFNSSAEIVNNVVEFISYDYDDEPKLIRSHAKRITRELIEQHYQEQLTWPSVTDCDRLDQAFEDLEFNGIVSRQNFSCCNSCGSREIYGEMQELLAVGESARGYTFYNMQDTESAAESGYGLFLTYGAYEDDAAATVAIGHEIVAALQKYELSSEWDGSEKTRIYVNLEWKRRR